MYEIFVIIIALLSLAKRRRRRRTLILKGSVQDELQPGALAADTAFSVSLTEVTDEECFALSCELTWGMDEATVGEGPIIVGVAHNDYSTAEIEEWIENTNSWKRGGLVEQEIAKRKIRQVGVFPVDAPNEVLNDGRPIKTTLKFTLVTGATLRLWCYNAGDAVLTAGTIIDATGHVWLKPR